MKLWIGLYHHRHGVTAFPLWCADSHVPTEDELRTLLEDFESGESVEIQGPCDVPTGPRFTETLS